MEEHRHLIELNSSTQILGLCLALFNFKYETLFFIHKSNTLLMNCKDLLSEVIYKQFLSLNSLNMGSLCNVWKREEFMCRAKFHSISNRFPTAVRNGGCKVESAALKLFFIFSFKFQETKICLL